MFKGSHYCSAPYQTKHNLVCATHTHLSLTFVSVINFHTCKLSNDKSLTLARHAILSVLFPKQKIVSLHLPLNIYNTRRVQNLACTYVSLQVVCPDTRCKHHSETICPCGYCSRQKKHKRFIDVLQFQVNETLTEPINPYVRKSTLLFLLQKNISTPSHQICTDAQKQVPVMHLTEVVSRFEY